MDDLKLTYELTYRDVVDIMKIVDESVCREMHLAIGDFRLDLVKGPAGTGPATAAPLPPAAAAAPATPPPTARTAEAAPAKNPEPPQPATTRKPLPEGFIEVVTPLAGMFYRAPAPGAKPFVEVGSMVEAGEQVAIVEVMKLMNSIKAPRKGVIREILVGNEAQVRMGQPLMVLEPAPQA
jgi:acetyl-CoA carboxylase biotin carboxyl carrier protein